MKWIPYLRDIHLAKSLRNISPMDKLGSTNLAALVTLLMASLEITTFYYLSFFLCQTQPFSGTQCLFSVLGEQTQKVTTYNLQNSMASI